MPSESAVDLKINRILYFVRAQFHPSNATKSTPILYNIIEY